MSMLVTLSTPSRWHSRAGLYPVPVPTSNTRWPSWMSAASSISAISDGALLDDVAVPFTRPVRACAALSSVPSICVISALLQ